MGANRYVQGEPMPKTITIDHATAAAHVEAFAREGRLEQNKWHGTDGQGREIACLLGSIHPEINAPEQCPASLMPLWLSRLTVRLFDGIPRARISEFGLAYAARLHRWSAIDAAGWERVRRAFIAEVLGGALKRREARIGQHAPEPWPEIKALSERLLKMLLEGTDNASNYRVLGDEARRLRDRACSLYYSEAAAEAEAEAEAVAEAAAEAAVAAEAAAAVVAVVAAGGARSASCAASFEILLSAIDTELAITASLVTR